jgi:hypothetical protein
VKDGGSTGSGDPSSSDSAKSPEDETKGKGGNQASDKKSEESAPPVSTNVSEAPTPTGSGTESTVVPTASVQMSGGPSDNNVSLGGNMGSANAGNGNGATVAEGTATQEAVPTAGPESNRVPPEYRSVVENYFNRGTP